MVGVFGGTFDPVHCGHLAVAHALMEALPLAQMVFVPAARPPHRPPPSAPAEHRLNMLRLAVGHDPRFVVDECEYEREGPSYMADTLATLRSRYGAPLALVLGMDAFLGLPTWHRWRRILGLAHIVIVKRPGWDVALPAWVGPHIRGRGDLLLQADSGLAFILATTERPESATVLRQALENGSAPSAWLPPEIPPYIRSHGLYRRFTGHDEV